MDELRAAWEERYRRRNTPWDTGITPPEVEHFWTQGRLPACGLALDLGCGTATNALYLANLGLHVVGVDLSGIALQLGRKRLAGNPVAERRRVQLIQADVTRLPLNRLGARYGLDIGCLQGIPPTRRNDYAQCVMANLAPGAYFHLYAFDKLATGAENSENSGRGLDDGEVEHRFAPHLVLIEAVRADPRPHPCHWYLLKKRD